MIRKFLTLILFLSTAQTMAFAQKADAILGKWLNPTGEGQIQIYKNDNLFFGKITWLKEPNDPGTGKPKNDYLNPNAALRPRSVLNLEILKNFSFNSDDTYTDGTIYDPKSGKTYSCKMVLNGNRLKIRGYIGISLLGRTEIWKRIK